MYSYIFCKIGLFVALALLASSVVCGLGNEAVRLAHDIVITLDLLGRGVGTISVSLDSFGVVSSPVSDLLSVRVGLRLGGLARLTSGSRIILLSCLGLDVVLELCAVHVRVLTEAVLHVPTQPC